MISLLAEWKAKSEELVPNIFMPLNKGHSTFNRDVKVLFEKIGTNPIGQRLLEKIRLCSSHIYIIFGDEDKAYCFQKCKDVVVTCSLKDLDCYSTTGEPIPLPKHVVLFHELTHAYHNISGKRAISHICDPLVWENDEEYKTVAGFSSRKNKTTPKITENAFRKAEGLPARFGSISPSSPGSMHKFELARLKLLGSIHEQNLKGLSENESPPPVALCSIKDLGVDNLCAVRLSVEGVDLSLTPKENMTANFYWVDPNKTMNGIMGDVCYFSPDLTQVELINTLVTSFFHLQNVEHDKIKSLLFMRISGQEHEIMNECFAAGKDAK